MALKELISNEDSTTGTVTSMYTRYPGASRPAGLDPYVHSMYSLVPCAKHQLCGINTLTPSSAGASSALLGYEYHSSQLGGVGDWKLNGGADRFGLHRCIRCVCL